MPFTLDIVPIPAEQLVAHPSIPFRTVHPLRSLRSFLPPSAFSLPFIASPSSLASTLMTVEQSSPHLSSLYRSLHRFHRLPSSGGGRCRWPAPTFAFSHLL